MLHRVSLATGLPWKAFVWGVCIARFGRFSSVRVLHCSGENVCLAVGLLFAFCFARGTGDLRLKEFCLAVGF